MRYLLRQPRGARRADSQRWADAVYDDMTYANVYQRSAADQCRRSRYCFADLFTPPSDALASESQHYVPGLFDLDLDLDLLIIKRSNYYVCCHLVLDLL